MAIEIAKNLHEFKGQKLVAFCASSHPEAFFVVLEGEAEEILERKSFPEGHSYEEKELNDLVKSAKEKGAILVTTRADWTKLPQNFRSKTKFLDINLANFTKKDLLTSAETEIDTQQQTPEEIAIKMKMKLIAEALRVEGKIALSPEVAMAGQASVAIVKGVEVARESEKDRGVGRVQDGLSRDEKKEIGHPQSQNSQGRESFSAAMIASKEVMARLSQTFANEAGVAAISKARVVEVGVAPELKAQSTPSEVSQLNVGQQGLRAQAPKDLTTYNLGSSTKGGEAVKTPDIAISNSVSSVAASQNSTAQMQIYQGQQTITPVDGMYQQSFSSNDEYGLAADRAGIAARLSEPFPAPLDIEPEEEQQPSDGLEDNREDELEGVENVPENSEAESSIPDIADEDEEEQVKEGENFLALEGVDKVMGDILGGMDSVFGGGASSESENNAQSQNDRDDDMQEDKEDPKEFKKEENAIREIEEDEKEKDGRGR